MRSNLWFVGGQWTGSGYNGIILHVGACAVHYSIDSELTEQDWKLVT